MAPSARIPKGAAVSERSERTIDTVRCSARRADGSFRSRDPEGCASVSVAQRASHQTQCVARPAGPMAHSAHPEGCANEPVPRRPPAPLAGLGLAVVLAVALMVGVGSGPTPRTDADRAQAIAATIKCPECDGPVGGRLDSPAARGRAVRHRRAPRARAVRRRDPGLAGRGASARSCCSRRRRSGIASLVWILPVVVLVAAVAGLAVAFVRWRAAAVVRRVRRGPGPGGRGAGRSARRGCGSVTATLSPDRSRRLEEERDFLLQLLDRPRARSRPQATSTKPTTAR